VVVVACMVFELFLRIHPYANGNGHAARFCTWAILGAFGYWPERWPIEPRPPDPPYTQLLVDYRNGNRVPLERYLLSCIAGN
jgi:Fic family protein